MLFIGFGVYSFWFFWRGVRGRSRVMGFLEEVLGRFFFWVVVVVVCWG